MKKLLFLLFAGFCLPFSVAVAQQQLPQENKPWGQKSMGVIVYKGGEKFMKPLTLEYFSRNTSKNAPQYFRLPPGPETSQTQSWYEVVGLGIEKAFPVGKRDNELRLGFAILEHRNSLSSTAHYLI